MKKFTKILSLLLVATLSILLAGCNECKHNKVSSEWTTDANNHWHVCEKCGEAVEIATHTLQWVVDSEATNTQEGSKHQECSVCGYHGPATAIKKTLGSVTNPLTVSQALAVIEAGERTYAKDGAMVVQGYVKKITWSESFGNGSIVLYSEEGNDSDTLALERVVQASGEPLIPYEFAYGKCSLIATNDETQSATEYKVYNEVSEFYYTKVSNITAQVVALTGDEEETIGVGEESTAPWGVNPYASKSDATVTYESANTEVATVDENGKVKGVAVGNSLITISAGELETFYLVHVIEAVYPTTLTGTFASKYYIGEKYSYEASGTNGTDPATMFKLQFSSSDPTVVTVDKDGNLEFLKQGSATITVKAKASYTDSEYTISQEIPVSCNTEFRPSANTNLKAYQTSDSLVFNLAQSNEAYSYNAQLLGLGEDFSVFVSQNAAGNAPAVYFAQDIRLYGVKSAATGSSMVITNNNAKIAKVYVKLGTHSKATTGAEMAVYAGNSSTKLENVASTEYEGYFEYTINANSIKFVNDNTANSNSDSAKQLRIADIKFELEELGLTTINVKDANGKVSLSRTQSQLTDDESLKTINLTATANKYASTEGGVWSISGTEGVATLANGVVTLTGTAGTITVKYTVGEDADAVSGEYVIKVYEGEGTFPTAIDFEVKEEYYLTIDSSTVSLVPTFTWPAEKSDGIKDYKWTIELVGEGTIKSAIAENTLTLSDAPEKIKVTLTAAKNIDGEVLTVSKEITIKYKEVTVDQLSSELIGKTIIVKDAIITKASANSTGYCYAYATCADGSACFELCDYTYPFEGKEGKKADFIGKLAAYNGFGYKLQNGQLTCVNSQYTDAVLPQATELSTTFTHSALDIFKFVKLVDREIVVESGKAYVKLNDTTKLEIRTKNTSAIIGKLISGDKVTISGYLDIYSGALQLAFFSDDDIYVFIDGSTLDNSSATILNGATQVITPITNGTGVTWTATVDGTEGSKGTITIADGKITYTSPATGTDVATVTVTFKQDGATDVVKTFTINYGPIVLTESDVTKFECKAVGVGGQIGITLELAKQGEYTISVKAADATHTGSATINEKVVTGVTPGKVALELKNSESTVIATCEFDVAYSAKYDFSTDSATTTKFTNTGEISDSAKQATFLSDIKKCLVANQEDVIANINGYNKVFGGVKSYYNMGIKFGTSESAGKMTIVLGENINAISVKVVVAGWTATDTVKVNDISFTPGVAYNVAGSLKEHTYVLSSASNEISIVFGNRGYLQSIEIFYTK